MKLKMSWEGNRMDLTKIGGVKGKWSEQGQETSVSGVDSLSPCSRALPEKLTGPQPVKKFPALYRIRRFSTSFTNARHPSAS